ncbi:MULTISPECIES: MFS transporter [Paenibacillus]|uniref:Major facilitator superfamily MFS_1 n=2 Tax=Paenibacillus lactis TaxID=228574 RepID=G4HD07_9BACL|nr:MFS transporter [Paenibacillus lactis]EHB65933.1 major facilitator superfamily MFS_1 [Paenibacillus lactis 154]MBP1891316.1 DHA1 family inner membrane transport protein [Paenibacillus lactis]MCM3493766.1 MFS transporter [Paenibacillus lactis]GIO93915.1 MFS transporter [Paenibacillus lactis]HAF98312.1 MFS transporter [Paenibacillus lactis]
MALSQQLSNSNPSIKQPFPVSILSLTVGAFAIGMTEFVIMGILPNVAADLNVSIAMAGQLITMYALGVAVGAPILTILTHKIPQKKLLLLLMGLFIFGNGISVFAPNYAVLMGARMLTALTHGTFFGVGAVIASGLVRPDKRAGAVSIMMAGLTIANIIGVPLGTFIGQQMGWRASFGAIAIMGVLALVGILIFIPQIRQEQSSGIVQQVKELLKPKLTLFLLIGALGNAGLFAVFTYIASLLIEITGYAEASVTWILILFGCGVTLGNIVGGKLADWKLMPSILSIYFATAVILAILTFTIHQPILAVVTIVLWGAASFAVMPGLQIRVMNLAQGAPALASTSSHSAGNLGNAAGAFIGGLVITHLSLNALPWVGAILAGIAFLLGLACYISERKTGDAAVKA